MIRAAVRIVYEICGQVRMRTHKVYADSTAQAIIDVQTVMGKLYGHYPGFHILGATARTCPR